MESLLPCEIHCAIVEFLDSPSIHFLSQVSSYWRNICRPRLEPDIDKMRTKLITTKLIEKNYISLFKYACDKKYKLGFRSYNAAAKIGNLEIIKFLHEKKVPLKVDALLIAVAYNNMDIIEWITSKFHDLNKEMNWRQHNYFVEIGRNIDLNTFKWFEIFINRTLQNNYDSGKKYIIDKIWYGAINGNNMDILKYCEHHYREIVKKCFVLFEPSVKLSTSQWYWTKFKLESSILYYRIIKNEHLDVMEWLHSSDLINNFKYDFFEIALRNNKSRIVKWLINKGYRWFPSSNNILEVIRRNFPDFTFPDILVKQEHIDKMVEHGRTNMLVKYFQKSRHSLNSEHTETAAINNHFGVIKWLHEQDVVFHPDIVKIAIGHGSPQILKWLYDKGFQLKENIDPMMQIVISMCRDNIGDYEIIKRRLIMGFNILENGGYYSKKVRFIPGDTYHNEGLVRSIYYHYYQYNLCYKEPYEKFADRVKFVFDYSDKKECIAFRRRENDKKNSERMNLDIIKWFYKKGYPLNSFLMNCAIYGDDIETIIWLYQNKCPINTWTLFYLFRNGKMSAFDFFHKYIYDFSGKDAMSILLFGTSEAIKWFHEKGFLPNDLQVIRSVLRRGLIMLETASWLYNRGYPWDGETFNFYESFHYSDPCYRYRFRDWIYDIETYSPQ